MSLDEEASHVCCRRYLHTWRKSFSWSGDVHHGKPSTDEEGNAPQTQQLDQLWDAAWEGAQDRKALSWRSNSRLGIFGVSRSRLTLIIRPIWKEKSQSIETKDIKWRHLVLVRVPSLNSSVMHPRINSCHFDSCGRRKNNLVRTLPEGLEGLASRSQYFYQDLGSWHKQRRAGLRGWVRSHPPEFR